MASLEDIAAMKMNAIVGNCTRLKDFIAVVYLSSYLTANQIFEAYQKKYSTSNQIIAMKALTYFVDIDFTEPIDVIAQTYSWKKIEKRLNEMLKKPNQLFTEL